MRLMTFFLFHVTMTNWLVLIMESSAFGLGCLNERRRIGYRIDTNVKISVCSLSFGKAVAVVLVDFLEHLIFMK